MKNFFNELQRRGVIKALLAYLALSWLLLQVVNVVTGMLNFSQLFNTVSLIVLTCGFPLVLYVSWHFDIGMQGVTRTPKADEAAGSSIKTIGVVSWVGLFAIVVVSSLIGVQYYNSSKANMLASKEIQNAIEKIDSIAVLPFVDETSEQDQAFLATGLAEEITSLLGRSDLFRVSASRSSQVLADRGLNPIEIGQRLGAQTILTGRITKRNERVNVRVELKNTTTNKVLWSETFARELKDIFELESEIGRAVVNLLQDSYAEAGDLASLSTTSDVDAYVLYLKGREEYRKQTSEAMQTARSYFEQAVAADPEYAQAYVALADTLALLSEGPESFGVLSADIAADLAEQNLQKASVREQDFPELYAVKGQIKLLRGENEGAIIDFDKAISLNPNLAIAHMWKADAFLNLLQYDEAIEAYRKSQSLDPLFISSSFNLGVLLEWQGRNEEAKALYSQMREDFPESPFPYIGFAGLYYGQGNYVEAIRQWKKVVALSPDNAEYVQQLLKNMTMLGLTDIIKTLSNDLRYESTIMIFEQRYDELFDKMNFEVAANPDDYWVAFEAGWYYSMFGDHKTAAELLTANEASVSDADKFYMPYCSPAIEMAWAHSILGNEELATALINECESRLNLQRQDDISYSEADYLAARIYAIKGNPKMAVSSLEAAIKNGWREWWTAHDPLLNMLGDNQEIILLIESIEKDLAKQREEARLLFLEDS